MEAKLLMQVFIVSFLVMFIWATMLEEMIFGKVRILFVNLNEFYKKPFFECPICMAPHYGTAIYWLLFGNNWKEWLIVIFIAAGINTVYVKLFPEK